MRRLLPAIAFLAACSASGQPAIDDDASAGEAGGAGAGGTGAAGAGTSGKAGAAGTPGFAGAAGVAAGAGGMSGAAGVGGGAADAAGAGGGAGTAGKAGASTALDCSSPYPSLPLISGRCGTFDNGQGKAITCSCPSPAICRPDRYYLGAPSICVAPCDPWPEKVSSCTSGSPFRCKDMDHLLLIYADGDKPIAGYVGAVDGAVLICR